MDASVSDSRGRVDDGRGVDVGPQSAVMDALVEQRTEEVTHVFFHFLIRILNDERAKMLATSGTPTFEPLGGERFTKCLLAAPWRWS